MEEDEVEPRGEADEDRRGGLAEEEGKEHP